MTSPYAAALRRAFELSLAYLDGVDEAPVANVVGAPELRARLDGPLPDTGVDASAAIEQLAAGVDGGLTASVGPRFFGWVMGGHLPAALAADWLTSTWDQCPGVHAISPAAAVVEEVCGRWLLSLFGLPEGSSFALVTGCQMAHVTCLAAARHQLLEVRGWDVERRGLHAAPPVRVLTSDLRHGSLVRALRLLGFGTDVVRELPANARAELTPSALARALGEDPAAPTIVVLQAGEVNTGAFDPFLELIPIARQHGAWIHVDGAFGLWASTSPEQCHHTRGVEGADSWATDGHKWLNVPYDSGYAFVRHPAAHAKSFSHAASYLGLSCTDRDPIDWTPEHSRRARAFATYAALLSLGRSGVGRLVSECCQHARELVLGIGALPGAEVVSAPQLNQGLVRFRSLAAGANDEQHDQRTAQMIARICASGEALFTGTTFRGRRCMRISVSNWKTSSGDVRRVLRAIEQCLSAG